MPDTNRGLNHESPGNDMTKVTPMYDDVKDHDDINIKFDDMDKNNEAIPEIQKAE